MTRETDHLTGRLHSYETLGTLDGPGLRLVVFLQGCPLRCLYCHNPDTWNLKNGREVTVSEIVAKARRMRPYFGQTGGVTLSGGEPLLQADFLIELLAALNVEGIHTALDTSGSVALSPPKIRQILSLTDLVLLDIKSSDPADFLKLTGQKMGPLLDFLKQAESLQTPLWLRQVIVPGLNDEPSQLEELIAWLHCFPALDILRIELLGYHTLGVRKYTELGLCYPLTDLSPLPAEKLATLQARVNQAFPPRV